MCMRVWGVVSVGGKGIYRLTVRGSLSYYYIDLFMELKSFLFFLNI